MTGERAKLGAEMLLLTREGWAVEDVAEYFSLTPTTVRALSVAWTGRALPVATS